MSKAKLASRLRGLVRVVREKGAPKAISLERGLKVAARIVSDSTGDFVQLSLTRDKTTAPSQADAQIVIDCLGWANAYTEETTTRAGLPCLLINEGASLF